MEGFTVRKWMKEHERFLGSSFIVLLAIVIFYISFYINENNLTISLGGFLFVLFLGVFATIFDHKAKEKKQNIWLRTVVFLIAVNILFAYINFVLFSEGMMRFLPFAIPYTLVILAITWFKDQLRKADEKNE